MLVCCIFLEHAGSELRETVLFTLDYGALLALRVVVFKENKNKK